MCDYAVKFFKGQLKRAGLGLYFTHLTYGVLFPVVKMEFFKVLVASSAFFISVY